jgi:hypothetical protein
LTGIRIFQAGELTHDGQLFELGKAVLKPLKIIAEGAKSTHGPFSVLLEKGAPEVVLDESASDCIDVHVANSAILVRTSNSKTPLKPGRIDF